MNISSHHEPAHGCYIEGYIHVHTDAAVKENVIVRNTCPLGDAFVVFRLNSNQSDHQQVSTSSGVSRHFFFKSEVQKCCTYQKPEMQHELTKSVQ